MLCSGGRLDIKYYIIDIIYVLFSRVIQLVFIRSGETFLDSTVHPQSLHSSQKLLRERLGVLHPGDNVHHHLGVALSLVVGEGDVEVRHGPEDGNQRLDGVTVDNWAVLLEVLAGEATLMDDLHLLHNGRFTRFSSSCKVRE